MPLSEDIVMNPKSQSYIWSFNDAGAQREREANLPRVTMKCTEYWPVETVFKPYAGPTLWTPIHSTGSGSHPFLTLTPKEPSSPRRTIPLVSLTTRRNGYQDSIPKIKAKSPENDVDAESVYSPPSIPSNDYRNGHIYENTHYNHALEKQVLHRRRRNLSPIFPDVFKLAASNRSAVKASQLDHNYTASKRHLGKLTQSDHSPFSTQRKSQDKQTSVEDYKANKWSFPESEAISAFSPPDRNDQDKGTLFSKRQQVAYSRIAREPTFLPVLRNDSVRRAENLAPVPKPANSSVDSSDAEALPGSQTKGENFASRLSKQQRRARRNYIRSHAHFISKPPSTETRVLDCVGHQTAPCRIQTEAGRIHPDKPKKEGVAPSSRPLDRDSLMQAASKVKARLVSRQFCDVLGQTTCRRCQEFCSKNFTQPPKEKVEELRRTPVPVTRESTIVSPTLGLQKVVIRVKDAKGEMSVAAIGVNPGIV